MNFQEVAVFIPLFLPQLLRDQWLSISIHLCLPMPLVMVTQLPISLNGHMILLYLMLPSKLMLLVVLKTFQLLLQLLWTRSVHQIHI